MHELHDVGSVWETLNVAGEASRTKLDVAAIGVDLAAGAILAAVDMMGNRHLLVPLLEGEVFSSDYTSANVRLIRLKLGDRQYASVVCVLRELDDIFTQFTRELLTVMPTSAAPAKATREALERWRRLFADPPSDLLSEGAQVGLIGELLTLLKLLKLGGERGLDVWTGPDGSQHDFRGVGIALEVKATLAREGRRVHISSLEQLNPPDGCELHMARYRLEAGPGGISLPELVSQVTVLVASKSELDRKLQQVGYREIDAGHYSRTFSVKELRLYAIDESFPRIVPASFEGGSAPAGVESVEYVIELTNEPPYPLGETESSNVFTRLAAS